MEAVIAAIYLDAGFDAARKTILRLWSTRITTAAASEARDAKSTLQEWAQARGLPPPTYTETGREGPDHQPLFTVEARLSTGEAATGRATGKRAAEQMAARALLDRMEKTDD
jgi:ribonuclease-3